MTVFTSQSSHCSQESGSNAYSQNAPTKSQESQTDFYAEESYPGPSILSYDFASPINDIEPGGEEKKPKKTFEDILEDLGAKFIIQINY